MSCEAEPELKYCSIDLAFDWQYRCNLLKWKHESKILESLTLSIIIIGTALSLLGQNWTKFNFSVPTNWSYFLKIDKWHDFDLFIESCQRIQMVYIHDIVNIECNHFLLNFFKIQTRLMMSKIYIYIYLYLHLSISHLWPVCKHILNIAYENNDKMARLMSTQ